MTTRYDDAGDDEQMPSEVDREKAAMATAAKILDAHDAYVEQQRRDLEAGIPEPGTEAFDKLAKEDAAVRRRAIDNLRKHSFFGGGDA